MSFTIVTRSGINIGADQWAFTINGDPSSGAGLKAAIGSVAVQLDSSPVNLFWEKTGPAQTDWVALSASGGAGVSAAASSSGAFRASSYSVPVDGLTDATAAFTTLVGTTIPQTGGPYTVLVGPGEVIKLASDFTVPPNVRLQGFGGLIQPASGKKVTLMAQPDSAGKMFDHSAGGTVVAGVPMTVKPEWWGAWATGAASAAVDEPASLAAWNALGNVGGKIEVAQAYAVTNLHTLTGDKYANISVVGTRPGAGWKATADLGAEDGTAVFTLQGTSAYSLSNVTFDGVTFQGNSTSDYKQLFNLSNTDGVYFNRCRFINGAAEGLYLTGQNHCRNTFVTNCYASNVGNGVQKLSAYNLNSDTCLLANSTAIDCGQGCEQDGRNARIIGNHFENCNVWGILAMSTWASWIDPIDGVTIRSSNNVIIEGNTFINCGSATGTGDATGHTTGGIPVPGNQGRLLITGNTSILCGQLFAGGADTLQEIAITNNYCDDSPNGNNYCVTAQKGRFTITGNTFRAGATSRWAGIVRCGDQDPVNTSGVIAYNVIVGAAYNGPAFTSGPEVVLAHNIFEQPPTGGGTVRYRFPGTNYVSDGSISDWTPGADTWLPQQDADFVYAPSQSSSIKVLSAVPARGTWQAGDRAINSGTTGPPSWLCTTGGTSDTILSGVTISTTLNSGAFTVTAGTSKVTRYQWVLIAGVAGAKQLTTYNPTTGVGTFDHVAGATVTSGATTYSPPVWTATNNAATLSIASQATGDILYANSTTTFARLAAGANGQYLSLASGLPVWSNAAARAANVNIGAGATATWTALAPRQLFTATTASATLTVSSIPAGEYLTLDVAQDATGGRVVTIAQTGMGSLVWSNGNTPPTLTTTASKLDTYEFFNDGARVVGTVVSQNT